MTTYEIIRAVFELTYFITAPVLVFFAWKMLDQLKIGSEQVKAAAEQIVTSKKISEIHAKRESMKIASEQATYFRENIISDIDKFMVLKSQGKYPILSRAVVNESWPTIESKTNDLPGLMKEVYSSDGLAVKTLNKIEGFAIYFACGVADADIAYRPLCKVFCDYVRDVLPFIIVSNEQYGQYSNTLFLYGVWGTRNHVEKTEKEISKHKEHLSKIKVPELKTFGSETENC